MPSSLLGALGDLWVASGLDAQARFYAEQAPDSPPVPRAVAERPDEVFPGPTDEERPVELELCVTAGSAAEARRIGRLAIAAVDPSPSRDRLAWSGGSEMFNERDSSQPRPIEARDPGGAKVWEYRIHYRFWISGTP